MIGVVIPYFQRAPGLLRRALDSVFAQEGSVPWRVYVVDDGSPAPARDELAGLPAAPPGLVTVLSQANAGPAAARNRALDEAGPDIDAFAFLDSDDAWRPAHLRNAATALADGADVYFADHKREDDAESRFTQCDYRPAAASAGRAAGGAYWCDREALFRAVVLASPIGTSTVVAKRAAIGPSRFPARLRAAGEDSLFWLDLLEGDVRAACGLDLEADYGRGVSIFNHRSWGDERSLRTTLDQMRAHRLMGDRLAAREPALADECRRRLADLDVSYCANLLACLRRLRAGCIAPALAYAGERPGALARLPEVARRALRQRAAQVTSRPPDFS